MYISKDHECRPSRPTRPRGTPSARARGFHCRHQGIAIIATDTDHVQPVQPDQLITVHSVRRRAGSTLRLISAQPFETDAVYLVHGPNPNPPTGSYEEAKKDLPQE